MCNYKRDDYEFDFHSGERNIFNVYIPALVTRQSAALSSSTRHECLKNSGKGAERSGLILGSQVPTIHLAVYEIQPPKSK